MAKYSAQVEAQIVSEQPDTKRAEMLNQLNRIFDEIGAIQEISVRPIRHQHYKA